jgi:hypothetical protein
VGVESALTGIGEVFPIVVEDIDLNQFGWDVIVKKKQPPLFFSINYVNFFCVLCVYVCVFLCFGVYIVSQSSKDGSQTPIFSCCSHVCAHNQN